MDAATQIRTLTRGVRRDDRNVEADGVAWAAEAGSARSKGPADAIP